MRSIPRTESFPAHTPAVSQVFTTVLSHGPLTRLEVARRAGLSAAAVTKAVRPLMEAGYLAEGADQDAPPALGRPANLVRVRKRRPEFRRRSGRKAGPFGKSPRARQAARPLANPLAQVN